MIAARGMQINQGEENLLVISRKGANRGRSPTESAEFDLLLFLWGFALRVDGI